MYQSISKNNITLFFKWTEYLSINVSKYQQNNIASFFKLTEYQCIKVSAKKHSFLLQINWVSMHQSISKNIIDSFLNWLKKITYCSFSIQYSWKLWLKFLRYRYSDIHGLHKFKFKLIFGLKIYNNTSYITIITLIL